MNLKKEKLCIILFLLFFITFSFGIAIYTFTLEDIIWKYIFFAVFIAHILITVICFKIVKIHWFSISGFFLIFSYVFCFGQLVVQMISTDYIIGLDVSKIINSQIYRKSMWYSFFVISTLIIGMIAVSKNINYSYKKEEAIINKLHVIKVGWTILLISLPLEIYYTILEISTGLTDGYLEVLEIQTSGILSQFAMFHIIGMGLLILGYSSRPNISKMIFCLYGIYAFISMLSGSRIYSVIGLMLLFYLLIKSTNIKISFKFLMNIVVIAFIVSAFLNVVADVRNEGLKLDTFRQNIFQNLIDNPLIDLLAEFGGTLYTVCLVISKVPFTLDYSFGVQFVTGWLTILPNINNFLSNVESVTVYGVLLQVEAIGGSYIGELYYSFGIFGIFFALFLGVIIQKISDGMEKELLLKNYIKVAYYILPVFFIILWVRGYYVSILRSFVWGSILIYTLATLWSIRTEFKKK